MGLGRSDDAEDALRESLDACTAGLGAEHVQTRRALGNLGYLLNQHGKHQECLTLTTPAVALAETILDETDYSFAQLFQRHAGALTGLERYEDAEPYYLRCRELCLASVGEDDRRTRQVIDLIAAMYDAWGRPEKAAEYRALLDDE
jgi:tetratricopeptide (TPR) repeat protein